MAQRVFIIRHGQTEWSLAGKHTSTTDLPLTDEGRAQATALSGKLDGCHFALVLCSPLRRARETCALAGFGDVAQVTADLIEWNYGDYEGLTTPEIREGNPGWWLWRDGCPGGERPEQIGTRIDRVLERIAEVEGDVLVFAHGHSLRVLTARWLQFGVDAGARFKLDAAALSVLDHERDTAVIERWNL
jgi:probable phosphoglycerate mutase